MQLLNVLKDEGQRRHTVGVTGNADDEVWRKKAIITTTTTTTTTTTILTKTKSGKLYTKEL
ncbi:unnamed protein product [Ceratitis capitata]|uniref:(Mediterranean fruit fly) hypothetical protein n=1 Tax=Ceratitis capitata TaxID=7213 RepID=A0A811V3V1_CERCA|nr:unnamed protein product [Ceratitis capitata]